MKIHIIQHIDFEDGGALIKWAASQGHAVTVVRPDKAERLPSPTQTDLVVLLGGTFDIEDESLAWLQTEKRALRLLLSVQKNIFGICGGAQLLTTLVGGQVTANTQAEIGWFDIQFSDYGQKLFPQFKSSEGKTRAFHWHRDIFSLPPGAQLLASSSLTKIQAYHLGKNILAVQFHPEITLPGLNKLLQACGDNLDPSSTTEQTATQMVEAAKDAEKATTELLKLLLDFFA